MTDISVNSNAINATDLSKKATSGYQAKLAEFEATTKKLEKSDLSNSPTIIEKKVSMLNDLISLAQKEGLDSEVARLNEILTSLTSKQSQEKAITPDFSFYQGLIQQPTVKGTDGTDSVEDKDDDLEPKIYHRVHLSDYENEEEITANIDRLINAGVSPKSVGDLVENLHYVTESKKLAIKPNTLNQIIQLRNGLTKTRKNERAESANPINHLGVLVFEMPDDNRIIMKDGKIIYMTPVEGEFRTDEDKAELFSQVEDIVLIDFASKYKKENGDLDGNALRVFSNLRGAGITYFELMGMTDFCLKDDGSIDTSNLAAIKKLKQAGAMSKDILNILSACSKDDENKIKEEDVETACELTQSIIGGDEIVGILSAAKSNNDVKEFFLDFSNILDRKAILPKLVPLIETPNNGYDENAMDVLFRLANNLLYDNEKPIPETSFIGVATEILSLAHNNGEETINDDSAGICIAMSHNKMNAAQIKEILPLCKDENGNFDEKLSDMVWEMNIKNCSFDELKTAIQNYKSSN